MLNLKAKLEKFHSLSRVDKYLFNEAYVRLGIMRAAIQTVPFKRLVRSLTQQQEFQSIKINDADLRMAQAIGNAVRTAANNTPWQSACLTQVLAAQRMMEKRGIGGVICIGATMDGRIIDKIRAHAWLKCGDEFITGEEGHEDYPVLTSYCW